MSPFFRASALALALALALIASAAAQSDPEQLAPYPETPPTPPAEAEAGFRVLDGFDMQLLAAEPLLTDPVAIAYDEFGRAYVAEMNDYQFKLVKIKGEFTWHQHDHTDEVFLVISGTMGIEFADKNVELAAGEMIVVPKGQQHKPYSKDECQVMVIEPKGVVNTGDAGGELTANNDIWI